MAIEDVLAACGFVKGHSGKRYQTYIKGDTQIVVRNNGKECICVMCVEDRICLKRASYDDIWNAVSNADARSDNASRSEKHQTFQTN